MKIPPQAFFNFCAAHVPLLRVLAEHAGEVAEAEVTRMVRDHAALHDELPETTWRRLTELAILIPTEPGASTYLVAEPLARLLTYLFDEANPATPEMVRGYVDSLDALGRKLARAVETDDVAFVGLAFTEILATLRRIHADLEETQRAVQNEVAAFKVNRERHSVRERYQRIVYWMERFVEPMVEVVRPDGPMAEAFNETERLLRVAREQSLFNDHPALERNLRYLRLVRHHSLRVFQDCRKELQPLYDALRRSSFIAAGAAVALERLQREGAARWGVRPVVGFCQIRIQHVPGDAAIVLAARRVVAHVPEPAPVLRMEEGEVAPPALLRRLWLDGLPAEVRGALPVADLLEWMILRYPGKPVADLVGGLTRIVFHDGFRATFSEAAEREYRAADGLLSGQPVKLEPA